MHSKLAICTINRTGSARKGRKAKLINTCVTIDPCRCSFPSRVLRCVTITSSSGIYLTTRLKSIGSSKLLVCIGETAFIEIIQQLRPIFIGGDTPAIIRTKASWVSHSKPIVEFSVSVNHFC